MHKKLLFLVALYIYSASLFAQQIPIGECGIIYIYDANGARSKRIYYCHNCNEPYPTSIMPSTGAEEYSKSHSLVIELKK